MAVYQNFIGIDIGKFSFVTAIYGDKSTHEYKYDAKGVLAHADGSYTLTLEQLSKTQLLILDDWDLDQLDRQGRKDLLEILEDRYQRGSTIITTQLSLELWSDYVGDSTLCDAICDRLLSNTYQINLAGESMRKKCDHLTDVDHMLT